MIILIRIADLDEHGSNHREVCPDTESSKSENEGSSEKSGAHRRYFWGVKNKRGRGEGMKPSVQEDKCRRETEGGTFLPTAA